MGNAVRIIDPAEYLTEPQILARWPQLTRAELRRARKANPPLIAFYAFAKASGGPCCTASQVQEYLDRIYLRASPCQSASPPIAPPASDSRSETTTSISPIPSTAESTTPAGMTPQLAQCAAEALAQEMSKPPRSRSRRSLRQHRKPAPAKTARLQLVKS